MPQTIKSRSGRTLVLPTPEEDAAITAAAMSDPDAVPHTDAEWKAVKPLLRRGAVLPRTGANLPLVLGPKRGREAS